MATSKAKMLKNGANKASRGLFAGMPLLNSEESVKEDNKEISNDPKKEIDKTENQNISQIAEEKKTHEEISLSENEDKKVEIKEEIKEGTTKDITENTSRDNLEDTAKVIVEDITNGFVENNFENIQKENEEVIQKETQANSSLKSEITTENESLKNEENDLIKNDIKVEPVENNSFNSANSENVISNYHEAIRTEEQIHNQENVEVENVTKLHDMPISGVNYQIQSDNYISQENSNNSGEDIRAEKTVKYAEVEPEKHVDTQVNSQETIHNQFQDSGIKQGNVSYNGQYYQNTPVQMPSYNQQYANPYNNVQDEQYIQRQQMQPQYQQYNENKEIEAEKYNRRTIQNQYNAPNVMESNEQYSEVRQQTRINEKPVQYYMPEMQQYQQYQTEKQMAYQQPLMQQYAQMQTNNVQPKQTTEAAPKRTRAAKGENSRYEKDKFLLLDIRGYRDYVEHMAKAANMSATKYIRNLIDQDMQRNMDIYQAHKELEERLRERR